MQLSLTADEAVQLWVQVAALYIVARTFAAVARRFGQPEVVGALLGGVLLGPSVLGAVWPAARSFMVPSDGSGHLLGAVSGFCLLMLLIVLGAETDLPLLRRLGRAAAAVSVGSIVVPLLVGAPVAYFVAAELLPGDRLAGAILLGGALGVSSLPIVARLVVELGVARRDFGQLAFAGATVNDVYGFLLLVVVGVIATSSGLGAVLLPVGGLAVLLMIFVTFGQPAVDRLLRVVRLGGPNPVGSLSVTVGLALAASALLQSLHVEAALGAFFAGVAVGRSRFQHSPSMRQLEALSSAVFVPIYFASAGLQVDLATLNSGGTIAALVALLVAAVLSKGLGAALGAAAAGMQRREVGALAVLLNGRGAMQVIIGSAGLQMGVISDGAYTLLLVISIVTSLSVAPALRRLIAGWPGSEAEQERLAHEERLRRNVLVRRQRLLVPVGAATRSAPAAAVLDWAWPPEAELTLLLFDTTVGPMTPPRHGLERQPREIVAHSVDPVAAVLAEANLGYGVIGVGVGEEGMRKGREPSLGAFAESILNTSPLPVVLVRPGRSVPGVETRLREVRNIAVAATGTTASRAAEELGRNLARARGLTLDIVHVVPSRDAATLRSDSAENTAADGVLMEAERRATEANVVARVVRYLAPEAGDGLLGFARDQAIDLLVLGTRLRRVQGRPFLGHTVETVLQHAELPVVVVALPEVAAAETADEPYTDRALG
ncbi:MAG TPA: cation:proton antiporter [Candidatus Limnocylindria bacterium]|nr:cation:proton antiporter [Candidatus Limnocylindria bacterium]